MNVRNAFLGSAVLALAGCEGPASGTADRGAGAGVPVPYVRPLPGRDGPLPTPTASPTPAGHPRPCNAIYDPDLLPTFELEIAPGDWQALKDDFSAGREEWHPAVFRYDGETVTDVMVRNRGNTSSCGDRMQFAIAFHKVDPDKRFRGLRRINLDHGSCRVLYERISMEFARERMGLAAPCANNALLVVNGTRYGLFANLEHQDREYLERNFALPDGNLYKAGKEKKTNEHDPDTSDLDALWDAKTPDEIARLVDLDQAIRMWAMEAVLPAADNYWYFGRNYLLYNHPERGFLFLPNDYDHGLPLGWNWDWEPLPARSTIAERVLQDPYWSGRLDEELALAHAAFEHDWYEERVDRYWAQIRDAALADPGLNIDDEEILKLKELFRAREALLDERLAP